MNQSQNRRSRSANPRRTNPNPRSPSNSSRFSFKSSDNPPFQRSPSIKDHAAKFFGVTPGQDQETAKENDIFWQRKRLRHLNRQYGVNPDSLQLASPTKSFDQGDILGNIVSNLPNPEAENGESIQGDDNKARIFRAISIETPVAELEKRESVFKMASDTFSSFLRGTPFNKAKNHGMQRPGSFSMRSNKLLGTSCSFPKTPMQPVQEAETSFAENETATDRPDVETEEPAVPPSKSRLKRTDSSTIVREPVGTTLRPRPEDLKLKLIMPQPMSRCGVIGPRQKAGSESEAESIQLHRIAGADNFKSEETEAPVDSELFYDGLADKCRRPVFTLDGVAMTPAEARSMMPPRFPVPQNQPETPNRIHPETPKFPTRIGDILRKKEETVNVVRKATLWQQIRRSFRESFPGSRGKSLSQYLKSRQTKRPFARRQHSTLPFGGSFKMTSTDPTVTKKVGSDESYADERPYFTYWITFTQIVIMILAFWSYGCGTNFTLNYFDVTERSGDVLAPSISQVHLVVYEQNNIWIGPRYADLVHMGAKYTPCMRSDRKIMNQIAKDRKVESVDTGCCVSAIGCYQTSDCAAQFSKLVKYDNSQVPVRGVCGQHPRYCKKPRSIPPYEWSTDISEWPICEENYQKNYTKLPDHLTCEIRGRPCCIQMHGQCRITTKEYCDFVNGYYHENATLCSQVSCLSDICGMTPFRKKNQPDQVYRLVTPLFIHAGVISCLVTVWIQFTYMRKFEMMIGWLRLSIIYFASGTGGYVASALFVPYMPQVGPAGAQMGVLGAMIINVIYSWDYLKNPWLALSFHFSVAMILFLFGLLPFIDNFGLIFGFIIGLVLGVVLIPYIGSGKLRRLVLVVFLLLAVVVLFIVSIAVFLQDPLDLPDLSWMSCISFGYPRICDEQSLQLKDWLPI